MEENCLICRRSYEVRNPTTHLQLVRFVLHSYPSCVGAMLDPFPRYYDFPTELREDLLSDIKMSWMEPVFDDVGRLVKFKVIGVPLFI